MSNFGQLLQNIIGVYTPKQDSYGFYVAGFAGLDWGYITRFVVFLLALYMFFKVLISLVSGLRR